MMPLAPPTTDAARLAPWKDDLLRAGATQNFPAAIVASVILRETHASWAPGYTNRGTHAGWGDRDRKTGKYHAFGLGQADERYNAALIRSGRLDTPLGQFEAIAEQLAANLRVFRLSFPTVDLKTLLRAAVAAYNASMGAVVGQLQVGADVDAVTTAGPSGHPDYSADVLARATLLVRAGLFPPWEPTT